MARLVAIVGFLGLVLFYGFISMAAEGESRFLLWLLAVTVLIAGPLEILSLLLSFFKEKIGYNLSLIFSASFVVAAVWLAFLSTKRLLFEAQEFDIVQVIINGGFGLLLFSPFALIVASYILSNSKNQKLKKISALGIVTIFLYLLSVASLFVINIITLGGE